jgi:hypothetical protein
LIGAALFSLGCLPPSLRSAHSLDKGDITVEAGFHLDAAPTEATILTLDGDSGLEFQYQALETAIVFGLGKGFELGARWDIFYDKPKGDIFGVSPILKYSLLDERRMKTPLSVAVASDRRSGGFLFSSNIQASSRVSFRPIANVWFGRRTYSIGTDVEDRYAAPETDLSSPGGPAMAATISYTGFDIPVGIEVPIRIGDDHAIVPVFAYSIGIPIKNQIESVSCSNCLFALESLDSTTPMSFFMGLRFQPWLRESQGSEMINGSSVTSPSTPVGQPDAQHRY